MKEFMDENFLLSTPWAQKLYNEYAKLMPIIDYHCHINPEEIAADRQFENITQIWLGGDHYKWRQMRANGIEEDYITGNASDWEKFRKWAEIMPNLIGNPLYHWSHLELKRYFGYDKELNENTAEYVWNLCNEKLKSPDMSARNLILKSNVKLICTTDDPADSLVWHKEIADDTSFPVKVLPTWRPEKAMNICHPDFSSYIDRLSQVSGIPIANLSALKQALSCRMDYFELHGCVVSDHSLDFVMYNPAGEAEIEAIFKKARNGSFISAEEKYQYQTWFMIFAGREYAKRGWTMQIHYGCKRDNNTAMYKKLGPDTGFDCISNDTSSSLLADFLDALNSYDQLPKTILYSLNPNDNAGIDSVAGCFQSAPFRSKIQHGSAWWFNDTKKGMEEHLITLASLGCLGNFIGMLTDSRSFLSYARHEYFRRILCNLIGKWVEEGEYPENAQSLKKIIEGISYKNAAQYFGFYGL